MTDAQLTIALVAAASRNGVIGSDGGLPWHLPSELKRFRARTMGHPCIMGRRTWESIGRPLPGRDMIVVTRGAGIAVDGVLTVQSLDEALTRGATLAVARGVSEIMIIGGGTLYAQALPSADRVYLTTIETDVPGDTYFPALPLAEWRETAAEFVAATASEPMAYTVREFHRMVPTPPSTATVAG
jgi:dihydrofolate reductase